MKEQLITKKILNWYDINKRSLPWRKKFLQKKGILHLVSEFMLATNTSCNSDSLF